MDNLLFVYVYSIVLIIKLYDFKINIYYKSNK